MGSFKDFFKQHTTIVAIFITIFVILFLLNLLVGMPSKEPMPKAAEDAAVQAFEVELKLIDDKYQVDTKAKQWQIDVT